MIRIRINTFYYESLEKVIDGLAIYGWQKSYCYQGFRQLLHHDVDFNKPNNGIDYETIDNLLNCNIEFRLPDICKSYYKYL